MIDTLKWANDPMTWYEIYLWENNKFFKQLALNIANNGGFLNFLWLNTIGTFIISSTIFQIQESIWKLFYSGF